MSKPAFVSHDCKDTRREVLGGLLPKLSPEERMRYLAWCCKRATCPVPVQIREDMWDRMRRARTSDEDDQYLTWEIGLDVWQLAIQYGLDIEAALAELERRVRGRDRERAAGTRVFGR